MALELCSMIAPSSTLTESPCEDNEDLTEAELLAGKGKLIAGQPAQWYNIYNHHLPYSDSLESEALAYLKEIKANLGRSLLLSVHKSNCADEIKHYLTLYGQYFTKEDHILLIKTFLQAIQIPGIELSTLTFMVTLLNNLLRKQRLISPDELTIHWRPLYDIYSTYILESKNLFQIGHSNCLESNLRGLIEISRNYFPVEATQEILDELRPLLCPFFGCKMLRSSFLLCLFLPTQLPPEHHDKGFKLWFDEIMSIWMEAPNSFQFQSTIFKLISRLASHNIGYIDWTPYMSVIFAKHTKHMNSSVINSPAFLMNLNADFTSVVNWMVAMIGGPKSQALNYLESLFKAVESNFHPSNMNRWNAQLINILSRLSSAFILRIYKERFRKKTWEPLTPEEFRITDEEIDKFVDILLPILSTAMFSRYGIALISTAIRILAWLRPEKVIPPLVEKLYIALDSNLEAHRLNSLMSALSIVAPAMVNGLDRYEDGKTHIISILFSSLPGLDCNDIKKCGNTFGLITNLVDSIPIMDCSAMVEVRDDLTESEYNIAFETARFEEFVLIFLEKVITLVENYSVEHRPEKIDNDPVKQSSDESLFESSMVLCLSTVLLYSSPEIFERALDKLFVYLRGRLFESKSTIKLMALVCGLFARAHPMMVLDKFLPYLHSIILGLTENSDVFEEESIDGQLSFALQISAEIIVEGDGLAKHKELIIDIIRRGLLLKSVQGYKPASCMLKNCIESLTTVYPNSNNSFSLSWEQLSDFKNVNPIRLWGKHDKLEDITINWHVPSDDEMKFSQQLLDEFLVNELNKLKDWTSGSMVMSREDVNRSLHVILYCVAGAACVLPPFEAEPYILIDTLVPPMTERVHEIGTKTLRLSTGENIRQLVAKSIQSVCNHILTHCDDDTKSLGLIVKIYQCVLGWLKSSRFMKTNSDNYRAMKKNYDNKLIGRKSLPRRIIIDRIKLQHETRLSLKTWGQFTTLHRDLIVDLFRLAISHYSDVRHKAQSALTLLKYPFSYRIIAQELVKVFQKKRSEKSSETGEIQGALTILLSQQSAAFMGISDWECVTPLWHSLVNTAYSEKPIIIIHMEQLNKQAIIKFQPLLIKFEVGFELKELARQLYTQGITPDHVTMPNEEEIELGMKACQALNDKNYSLYVKFVRDLVDSIENGKLHWRHLQFAFLLLQCLIRKDVEFPIEGVRLIVKNLINEHIIIRRLCINGVAALLKKNKPTIEFNKIPINFASDNYDWLYLNPDIDYTNQQIWNNCKFVNKTILSPLTGYKEGIKYYTEKSSLPSRSLESCSKNEAPILEFFLDKSKVTQLLDFMSLDDKKAGAFERFEIFKGLFRNFGITLLPMFVEFLENMITETKDSVHKCGCDVLTGLVKGSKYWPYSDVSKLRETLEPILLKLISNITRETTDHYAEFISFGFRGLDGKRFSWLFTYLIEDPLSLGDNSTPTVATSFQQASKIKILNELLMTQCWRALPYSKRLFNHLLEHNHLKNPYQNVRELIGYTLAQRLQYDNKLSGTEQALADAPRVIDLINTVLPELSSSILDYDELLKKYETNGDEGLDDSNVSEIEKDTANLMMTLCHWLQSYLLVSPRISQPELFEILPIICEIKNRSKDDEIATSANNTLNSFGRCSINEQSIDAAFFTCKKMVSNKSWHTRVSAITFIQSMVLSNLFTIMNNPERNKCISDMIIDLLQDERIEVREQAAIVLGGLVHYQFVKVDKSLIDKFKTKCGRKLTRDYQKDGLGYNSIQLNEKHCGALGLCSIVSAYPYDVPEFLPDILMFLAEHLHDPQPIPTTIKKTLSDFKRTHYDNWRQHKEKFNEDQLAIITDLLVSPNYYA